MEKADKIRKKKQDRLSDSGTRDDDDDGAVLDKPKNEDAGKKQPADIKAKPIKTVK